MWILILMFCSADYRGGVSVASISGFKSEEACNRAGNAAIEARPQHTYLDASHQCVKQ